MKSPILSAILAASLAAVTPPAFAQSDTANDPTPEEAQAYQDAQGCAIMLKAAGSDEDLRMADLALARASELARVNGDDTEEKFAKSMQDWAEILDVASPEETSQFVANCRDTWTA